MSNEYFGAHPEGQIACFAGTLREQNPYTVPRLRDEWFAGFDSAQIERDEWESANYERCRWA